MVDTTHLFAPVLFCIIISISFSSADYSIRTRTSTGKEELDLNSPTVISTLGIPPYISNFYNDSDGLVPDLLRHLEKKGILTKNYSLVSSDSPTLGLSGDGHWTGLMSDVRNKFTHYVIGPTPRNLIINPGNSKIVRLAPWAWPEVVLVIRTENRLNSFLDLTKVKLIVVENSAEDQLLSESRSKVGSGLERLQHRLSRAENVVKVKNLCEGLRLLGIHGNDRGSEEVDQVQALVTNSLDAGHFVSGNRLASIIKPANQDQDTSIEGFIVVSNPQFENLAHHFEIALKQLSKEGVLQKVVNKWSKYDEKACKRLEAALSNRVELTAKSAALLIGTLAIFVILRLSY